MRWTVNIHDFIDKNKQLLTVLLVLAIGLGVSVFGMNFIVEKASQRVIQKLQRDYSPAHSPYGPGIDPDKIDPPGPRKTPAKTTWDNDWEKDRR